MIRSDEANASSTRQSLLIQLRPDCPAKEVAWTEFQERYAPVIRAFARRFGVLVQDLPDVVQDVLIGFFARSPRFVYDPSKGRFRSYLKTCTFHACAQRFKANARFAGKSIDQLDPADESVEQVWTDVWEMQKLRRALDRVREHYQGREDQAKTFRAFELYVLLERPADEVAAELAISRDSVHAAKTRVSKALKEAVAQLDSEE